MRQRIGNLTAGKPPRCNHCWRQAVVSISWSYPYSSMGQRRGITVTASVCAEHEGCESWLYYRNRYPDAPLKRYR